MNYNDGAPKNPKNIADKRQAAHDFAEGNNNLEKLLNYCFDNNILTNSSCAGHEYEPGNIGYPYVGFYVCKENEELLKHLIGEVHKKGYDITYNNRMVTYPHIAISSKEYPSNLFVDLLEIIKNYKQYEIDPLSDILYKIISNTADKYESIIKIETKGDTSSVAYYVEQDYVENIVPEKELTKYFTDKANSFYFDITRPRSLLKLDEYHTKERLWQDFQIFMQENDIEFTDPSIIDLTEWTGAYGKDTKIKKQLVVKEGDTIEIVAKKLEALKDQFINTKAVLNGIELVNYEYSEEINSRGKKTYNNIFTKELCITNYYNEIIESLNKNIYSGELQILKRDPMVITFSNPALSDIEIAKRLEELNTIGINAWFTYPYIDFKISDAINSYITIEEIKKRKTLRISYEIIKILSTIDNIQLTHELFNIYSQINSNNIAEIFPKYKRIIDNSGLNLSDINNNYLKTSEEFDKVHKYLKYDTYILYKSFKIVLESSKEDPIIADILNELDTLALASVDTEQTINTIIQKYRKYIDNKKQFDSEKYSSEFRL